MNTVIGKIVAHLSEWKLEYLVGGAYLAGHFNLASRALKTLARFV